MRSRLGLMLFLVGSLAVVTDAGRAAQQPDMPQSYLFGAGGTLSPLRSGSTYRASQFPIPLRLKPFAGGWSGAQWKSGRDYFRGGPPPNFGWVHVGRGSSSAPPLGLITIMTAYAKTPSVATTVNVLRTRGRGASYQDSEPIRIAGFSGMQFDGEITGAANSDHIGHYFVPFSPRHNSASYFPDEYPVYGQAFRVIVLDVRGKTVVIYIENVALSVDQYPAFLTKATRILAALRFPPA
jgi:hypothetical protein